MKKPRQLFAIFLWFLGLILLAIGGLRAIAFALMILRLEFGSGPSAVNTFLLSGAPTLPIALLVDGGLLAGLGLLIELIDQILWNGLSEAQREAQLNSPRRRFGA